MPSSSETLSQNALIKDPPNDLSGKLRHLGPSLILTANIVGSGELIVTTTLGAKAGFVLLWIVILSCVAKVAVQFEFGKFAIRTGLTSLQAFNVLPGKSKKGKVHWTIYVWLVTKIFQQVQYGGIVGGVALVLNMAFPSLSIIVWAIITGATTALLATMVNYKFLEFISVSLVAVFSIFTIFCLVAVQFTSFQISMADIAGGFVFSLPYGYLGLALAMFAITGVGADEIISYPYWCLEKGYARFAGPDDSSKVWQNRTKGWINVMYLDGTLSLVIYTLSTVAFYLLGAAILHSRQAVPEGYDLIRTLSSIYGELFGNTGVFIFLAGAFVTLFSTLYVACMSSSRMFADAFSILKWVDVRHQATTRLIRVLGVILPVIWTMFFLTIEAPLLMITTGAFSLTVLLVLVLYASIVFNWQNNQVPGFRAGSFYNAFFWMSALSILFVAVKTVAALFR